ncbi:MAG TPA: hypothetical protein PLP46_00480 [bacterium]|nr:hypothetical protein [bacterium]
MKKLRLIRGVAEAIGWLSLGLIVAAFITMAVDDNDVNPPENWPEGAFPGN